MRKYTLICTLSALAVLLSTAVADPDWRVDYPYNRRTDDGICNVSSFASGVPAHWAWDGCTFATLAATDASKNDFRTIPLERAGEEFGESLDTWVGTTPMSSPAGRPSQPSDSIDALFGYKDTLFVFGEWQNDAGTQTWATMSAATFAPASNTKARSVFRHSYFLIPDGGFLTYVMPMYFAPTFGALDDDVDLEDVPADDILFLVGGKIGSGDTRTSWWGVVGMASNDQAQLMTGGPEFNEESDTDLVFSPIGAARYDAETNPSRFDLEADNIRALAYVVGWMATDSTFSGANAFEARLEVRAIRLQTNGDVDLWWSQEQEQEDIPMWVIGRGERDVGFDFDVGLATVGDSDDFMMVTVLTPSPDTSLRYGLDGKTATREPEDVNELISIVIPKTIRQDIALFSMARGNDIFLTNEGNTKLATACEGAISDSTIRCIVYQPQDESRYNAVTLRVVEDRDEDSWNYVLYEGVSSCEACDAEVGSDTYKARCQRSCFGNGNVGRWIPEELGLWVLTWQVSRPVVGALSYLTQVCYDEYACKLIGWSPHSDVGGLRDSRFSIHQMTWVPSLDLFQYGNNAMRAGGVVVLGGFGAYSMKYKKVKSIRKPAGQSAKEGKGAGAKETAKDDDVKDSEGAPLAAAAEGNKSSGTRKSGASKGRARRGTSGGSRRSGGRKKTKRASMASTGSKRSQRSKAASTGSSRSNRSKASSRGQDVVASGSGSKE